MSQKKLFLLDGMALIYRAFFAFSQNPRITSYGLNTNAMFGFVNTLLDVINKQKPTHLACVFDTSAPTERHDVYEKYKAHREEMPEDLAKSLPYIFKILEAFNIPCITFDGYEADDIIASIAVKLAQHGQQVTIVSTDKGFLPLLSQHIQIYDAFARQHQTEEAVQQKFGVSTAQLVRYWSLVGDSTNNIPGVNGIGPKGAHDLLALGATLTEALEHPDCHKKLREKILQHKEQIKVFMQILALKTDVQLGLNLQDMRIQPVVAP